MGIDGGPTPAELGITENIQKKPATAPAKEPPKELTPADRAVNKALKGIDDNLQDLLGAGVTEEQIKQAKEKAEQRIRTEFKELEGKDPLTIIEKALEDSVQTEGEKDLVSLQKNSLEWQRSAFSRDDSRQAASQADRDPSYMSSIRGGTGEVEWRRTSDRMVKGYRILEALSPRYVYQSGEEKEKVVAESNEAFQERFLRDLGVLQDDETLKDIYKRSYKQYDFDRQSDRPTPNEPYMPVEKGMPTAWIVGLPTKIEGVFARIKPYNYGVELALSAQTLQRIQSSGRV